MQRTACLSATAALAACAWVGPPPLDLAKTESDAIAMLGRPTARYPMPGGALRIEFARGPMGRETWMVDLGVDGRVRGWFQALEERRLHAFQARAPGMSREELLRTLGTPGERRHGGWQGGEVWSYRYPTNDCLWFQVGLNDAGIVTDGGFGIDWRCDARGDKVRR
jgi:hypothetical protein